MANQSYLIKLLKLAIFASFNNLINTLAR